MMKHLVEALRLIVIIVWVMCLGGVIISLVQAQFLQALGCFLALWFIAQIKITYREK